MDSLTYTYAVNSTTGKLESNKLYHVSDLANSASITEDIKDQGSFTPPNQSSTANTNYAYDAIGQLTTDKQEKIDSIKWNVYGKISRIYYSGGKPYLQFLYDASGNRIAKFLKNTNPLAVKDTTFAATYYWRDAQGNILATESKKYYPLPNAATSNISHTTEVEYNIYGSSRLGTLQDTIPYDVTTLTPYGKYVRYYARRQYELSNHLGNVMAMVSDVKTYSGYGYRAKVLSAQNYYPFGMQMPGKTFNLASYSSLNSYRFGFNGMERDDEVKGKGRHLQFGDYGYDPATGRRMNNDLITFPWQSTYATFNNNPIYFSDPDGLTGRGRGGNGALNPYNRKQQRCSNFDIKKPKLPFKDRNKKTSLWKNPPPVGTGYGVETTNKISNTKNEIIVSEESDNKPILTVKNDEVEDKLLKGRKIEKGKDISYDKEITFEGAEDNFCEPEEDVLTDINKLVQILKENPTYKVIIIGNTSTDKCLENELYGKGDEVYNQSAIYNGRNSTTGELMLGRARKIMFALWKLGVKPWQTDTEKGTHRCIGAEGRKTTFKIINE